MSFNNLVELHVLRALRTKHGVAIRAVRSAIAYAENQLDVSRLLLRPELRALGGDLLLERYGELVSLSQSGQLVMRQLLQDYLQRVDRGVDDFPIRLFPIVRGIDPSAPRMIAIDPTISFGRPIVLRRGVSTATIAERIDAGESVKEVADDYDMDEAEVMEALVFEQAA